MKNILLLFILSINIFALEIGDADADNQCKYIVGWQGSMDYKFVANYNDGTCGGDCNSYCRNLYPVGSEWSGGVNGHEGEIINSYGWAFNPTNNGAHNDLYCKVGVRAWTYADNTPNCDNNESLNYTDCTCEQVDPSTGCPPNSTWNEYTESCECNSPFTPSYDVNNGLSCLVTNCPKIYEAHNPPLPLFMQTDNVNNCNFFPLSDSAYFQVNDLVCCYGQESIEDDVNCPENHIKIGENCYPIDSNSSDEAKQAEIDECNETPEMMWSNYYNACVSIYGDRDTNASDSDNGTVPNPNDNGDTNVSVGSPESDGDLSYDDYEGDGGEFGIDMDGAKNQIYSVLNSYVLIELPISVSGSCSSELRRTISVMGKSYTIDLAPYMAELNNYLPTIKMLILFMFALSGVIIVLSSGRD